MTEHELKELKNLGAELGAAKAERERFREALETCAAWFARHSPTAPLIGGFGHAEHPMITFIAATLSQQAEPAEPAPTQDEREAFEVHMRLGGYSNPEKRADGSYVSSAMELWWQGWKARAARPAQTAPQSEFGDAYQGAREDLAIWKRRALESEQKVRQQEQIIDHLTLEAQGETRMGEPVIPQTAPQGKFVMGDLVKKSTGSEWEGHICGTYSTELTPEGYAVESAAHRGSVQIYPAKALEAVDV